jgi:Predicted membrane protein (DUF2339)
VAGLLVVIRKENWWLLSLPAIGCSFLWVLIWLFGSNFTPNDTIWLGAFLIAVSATVVIVSKHQYESESVSLFDLIKLSSALNYFALGGSLLLMGLIGSRGGFGLTEWAFFGALSAGAIGLAFFNQRLYGLVPLAALAVNAVMFVTWRNAEPETFAISLGSFGALFALSGYFIQFRSTMPLLWAGLFAASSIGYYLLSYFRLRDTSLFEDIPYFWGLLAFALASFSIYAAQRLARVVPADYPQKQHLLTVFVGTGTTFLCLALTVELKREFLSVAIAAEALALAWINTRVEVKSLRVITGLVGCVFAFLLTPQVLLLIQLTAFGLIEAELPLQKSIPIVDFPVFQLGLPALLFAGTSYYLRRQTDDRLVRVLEMAAVGLLGLMSYYLTRRAFHVNENVLFVKAGFFERGVVTNALYVYGLACLWFGRRFARFAISYSGLMLCGIALFRIAYFDLIAYNPLWAIQDVGDLPIANALLLTYGLPIVWTWKAVKELPHLGWAKLSIYGFGTALLLSFTLVSLTIRQLFHGAHLGSGETEHIEIYTYSLVWLLFSLALLFVGTVRRERMLRVASLLFMLLTAGKVFLYDASALEGLYRFFSFLGLGLSLLGISWFYTRFVFDGIVDREPSPSATPLADG